MQNKRIFDELPWIINAEILIKLFGMSKLGVMKTMRNKKFPSFKIGHRRYVEKDKLERWIYENQNAKIGKLVLMNV